MARREKRHMFWRGGSYIHKGYTLVYSPDHPNANSRGFVAEHRFIMSQYLERGLEKGENVHHKNGNKLDNRIENLELWSTSQPSGQRVKEKINWAVRFLNSYGYEVRFKNEIVKR